jgi:hypothetical protein
MWFDLASPGSDCLARRPSAEVSDGPHGGVIEEIRATAAALKPFKIGYDRSVP